MPSNEKQLLEKALGLSLAEVGLDWPQFQKDYGIRHDDPADEAADRAFFTWQRFRGEHRANSCLLDDEGRVRGLIIKSTGERRLRLPELPALEYLCVCENKQLEEIELAGKAYPLLQYVDWSNNALSVIRLTAELPLLAYLNVSRNKASQLLLPKALPALKELDACHNQIRECTLPDVLPELAYLFLEGNGMTVLRTQAKLNALRTLNLRGNQLTELPKAEYAALETLYLKGNPLSGFGEDLLKGDKTGNAVEIIAALRSFAQTGERPNQRAKLIVVGNGRIGKTCLVKRLKGLPCERREVYTHGIAISELEKQHLPGVKTDELTLKVWDFGGQEVFYATHQFFMSEEAAYIYVWTDEDIARKNWENDEGKAPRAYHESDKWREHEYWLENIRMHGKDSPVVVVKTHCLDTRGTFPAERLKTAYALKHDPVDFDAFSPEPRYLENLAKAMTEALNRLPLLGQPIPRGFHDLVEKIDALRDDKVLELSKQDFLPLASACQIPEQDADAALGYLRKTGEVIHFPDSPSLRNKIYVNPGVLTERAYKLIESNDHLTEEEGVFTTGYAKKCLGADWEDLLELLINFQLIYRKKSGGSVIYIAPQYLPLLSKAGRNARNAFLGNETGKTLRFTLRYPQFLPENVMVNVLSEYGPYALDAVYRDAIFFCKEGQIEGCVIKADEGKREIQVYTTSSTGGDALAREVFEQFVTLSKKAALHIAVKAGEWVDVKPLQQALGTEGVTTLPLVGGGGFAKLVEFDFLRAERGHSFGPGQAPNSNDNSLTTSDMQVTIRDLVAKSKLAEALAVLEKWKPDEAILLQQRYQEMKKGERLGTWTSAEIKVESNKIANAVLEYAAELDPAPERGNGGTVSGAKRILFLAASPMNEARLQLDLEYNKIQKELKLGRHYNRFEFLPPVLAATVQDLLRAMNDQPEIVHFSGHGEQEGILVAGDANQARLLPTSALVRLFKPVRSTTKCVLLNSCYSAEQAKVISELGILVIGYNAQVGDNSAIEFVRGFYTGLGEGKDFDAAFNDAMIAWSTNTTANVSAEAWQDGELLDW
jgi:internalin A